MLLALRVGLLASLALRTPLKVDVVRDRAALSRIVAGGKLENVYRLQVMNATEQPQRYRIAADGPGRAGRGLRGRGRGRRRRIALGRRCGCRCPTARAAPGSHPIQFDIGDRRRATPRSREKSVFLVPR